MMQSRYLETLYGGRAGGRDGRPSGARSRSMEPSASPSRQRLSRAYRDRLDWDGFRDLYYPDSRRHNLEAVVAYGSYKSSSHAGSANQSTISG